MSVPWAYFDLSSRYQLKLVSRREQSDKGPIDPVIDGIASFNRLVERDKVRQDCLVSDSRIIKTKGADEEPIARNPMGVRRMSARQQRECDHGGVPNRHLRPAPLWLSAI